MDEDKTYAQYLEHSVEIENLKEKFEILYKNLSIALNIIPEFKKDPELNEEVYMGLYNIKKIIEMLESIIINSKYLSFEKQKIFLNLFNAEFLKRINKLYTDNIVELEKIKKASL